MTALATPPKLQFLDANGAPLVGGKLYTYAAGTTTPQVSYTDFGGGTANANPVILDSRGEASVWLGTALYKMALYSATDVLIWTVDNIGGFATLAQLAASGGSNLVGFLQAGTGAVATTVQAKLRENVSILDFGANTTPGVTDMTAALQAAIDYATILGKIVFIPAGVYLVTDTISIPSFTALYGEHQNMSGGGFGVDPKGTRILFQPTSAKSLFVASGTPPFGTFRSGYYIDGLSIEGNSTTSAGNSIYAIDVDMVTQSIFQNLAIKGFRTGIRCYGTINNRFQFIRIDTCFIQCILYDGNTATTDTWEQCYIRVAPIGVQTSGTSLGIKFSNCIFESLETYGVNLAKECFAWEFDACYAENIPTVANVNAAMFRVGYDGTTPSATIRLTVTGGYYGGSNAFASTANAGHWLDCDYSTGVSIASAFTARFYYSIRTTANTTNGSIVVNGLNAIQQTGITVGTTGKIQGNLPNGLLNSGTLAQDAYNALTNTNRITAYDGNGSFIRLDGAIIRINPGSGNQVYPVTDNAVSFGISGNRWSRVYATTFYAGSGSAGVSGTFTTVDGKTVTVTGGVITGIV